MSLPWFRMSEGQTTAAIQAASRFAEKEAAIDALIAAGPGGGGANYNHQATTALTNAQIKALPTSTVSLVTAPGANIVLIPVFSWWHALNWVIDYNNIHAASHVGITYTGIQASPLLQFRNSDSQDVINLLRNGASHGAYMTLRHNVGSPPSAVGQFRDDPGVIATGLSIYANNVGAGNFTEGDDAQTIRVSLIYYVLDLSTGLYQPTD